MLSAFFKRLGLRGIMSYVQITVLMCYFALDTGIGFRIFHFFKDLQQDCKISLSHSMLTNKYLLFKC